MKRAICLALAAVAFAANAHEAKEEKIINTATELRDWCKSETRNYYIARKSTPYNWSASWWQEGNTLHVKGSWRVEPDNVEVLCQAAKGGSRKHASYDIQIK